MAESMRAAMEEAGVPVSDPAPPDSEGRHPSWLTSRVVGISSHAVRRYQERVAPYLDSEQAKIAIYRLFEVAIFAHNAPRWTVNVSIRSTGCQVMNAFWAGCATSWPTAEK